MNAWFWLLFSLAAIGALVLMIGTPFAIARARAQRDEIAAVLRELLYLSEDVVVIGQTAVHWSPRWVAAWEAARHVLAKVGEA